MLKTRAIFHNNGHEKASLAACEKIKKEKRHGKKNEFRGSPISY